MKRKFEIGLVIYSVLFFLDAIISIGKEEFNPFFSMANKFIFFPISIIIMLLMKRNYEDKLKYATGFLIGLFSFALIWNLPVAFAQSTILEDFENNTVTQNQAYCYKEIVFGTCQTGTKSALVPSTWTTFSQIGGLNITNAVDNKNVITNFASSGSFALQLWWQPPNSCGYNITTTSCGNTTAGLKSGALSPIYTLPSGHFTLKFDSTILAQYPVKCDGYFCVSENYGTACLTGNGTVRFVITDNDCRNLGGNLISIDARGTVSMITSQGSFLLLDRIFQRRLPSQAGYQTFEVNLEPYFSNPDVAQNISLVFTISNPDDLWNFPIGWSIDNIRAEPRNVTTSPAIPYIRDLTTLTSFPVTIADAKCLEGVSYCSNTSWSMKVSRLFGDWALFRLTTGTTGFTNSFGFWSSDPIGVAVNYNNGSMLEVRNVSRGTFSFFSGTCGAYVDMTFPVLDVTNVKNLTLKYSRNNIRSTDSFLFSNNFTFTFDTSTLSAIRKAYSNTITDGETLQGQQYLFPVVLFNNTFENNFFHRFGAFNFIPKDITASFIEQRLFRSDGTLRNFNAISSPSLPTKIEIDTLGSRCPFEYLNNQSVNFASDWINASGITVGSTDIVQLKYVTNTFIPFNSNVSSNSTVTIGTTGVLFPCSDQCDGTTFKQAFAFTSNNVISCLFTNFLNDTRCIVAPVGISPSGVNQSLLNPPTTVQEGVNIGITLLNFFTTPFAIATILMIVIAGITTSSIVGVAPHGEINAGLIFGIVIILMTIFYAIVGIYPAWIGIILIVITGLILSQTIGKKFFGG